MTADLRNTPLYKLQLVALDDALAAAECARRYAESVCHIYSQEERERRAKWLKQLGASFLAGLRGEENTYRMGRGGNFARPLSRAHNDGWALRKEMQAREQAKIDALPKDGLDQPEAL